MLWASHHVWPAAFSAREFTAAFAALVDGLCDPRKLLLVATEKQAPQTSWYVIYWLLF